MKTSQNGFQEIGKVLETQENTPGTLPYTLFQLLQVFHAREICCLFFKRISTSYKVADQGFDNESLHWW